MAQITSTEFALELLRESGQSIRSSWELFTNLIRNYLYLNLMLFTIFVLSVAQIPQLLDSKDGQKSLPLISSSSAPVPVQSPVEKRIAAPPGQTPVATKSGWRLVTLFSGIICFLGAAGAVMARYTTKRLINHARRFLSEADRMEEFLRTETGAVSERVNFYTEMFETERQERENTFTMAKLSTVIFWVFGSGWIVIFLLALGYRYLLFDLS